jgi:hypothetical protein
VKGEVELAEHWIKQNKSLTPLEEMKKEIERQR